MVVISSNRYVRNNRRECFFFFFSFFSPSGGILVSRDKLSKVVGGILILGWRGGGKYIVPLCT